MASIKNSSNSLVPILIIGGLFFVFGFVTWLNGSLIPFLQIACDLTHLQAYFVTLAFYISYTVMALPVAFILRRTGYKNGLALGLAVMVLGALLFIPAAYTRIYGVFLTGLFVLGTGLTLLQTAANPYIVLIGPRRTAAVRISVMGLLNKSAGILAPIAFTALILSDIASFDSATLASLTAAEKEAALSELAQKLIRPYLILAASLAVLSMYIKSSPLPDPTVNEEGGVSESPLAVFRHPNLVLGVIALFFYMGAEVIAGDTIGLFGRELGVQNFGQLTAYTMAFMMCGYATGVLLIPRVISQEGALVASALLGVVLSLAIPAADVQSTAAWSAVFAWLPVPAIPNAVFLVAVLGFANALMWPAIWPMALRGLSDSQIGTGSALLIMSIAGGAIIPLIFGALADVSADPRSAYWIILPCYLLVLFYAVFGHRLDHWGGRS
jgi:glucose/galactose transporter